MKIISAHSGNVAKASSFGKIMLSKLPALKKHSELLALE